LDDLSRVSDFSPPTHLIDWLDSSMEQNNKGIFLVQMERGMGKTTFSKALDEQGLSKIILSDTTIRSYYINDTYLYKTANFVSDLNDIFRQDQQGKTMLSGSIFSLKDGDNNHAQMLARFLNFYKEEHRKKFGKRRLLFIIDGLDEIPAIQGKSIFDYIPKPEFLDNQVYILLTCRVNSEVTPFTLSHLNNLELSEHMVLRRNEKESIDHLHSYVRANFKSLGDQEVEYLLDKAEHRLVYLASIKEILNFSNVSLQEIPSGEKIFEYFLQVLETSYGSKFFKPISRLLCIIASSFEPLTLKEISYLAGEDQLSFKMLAFMLDVKSVLKVERNQRGSVFTIPIKERREKILSYYTDQISGLLENWSEISLSLNQEAYPQLNAGEHYLLVYIISYHRKYNIQNSEIESPLLNERFADKLLDLGIAYRTYLKEERNRQRHHIIFGQAIFIYEWLQNRGALNNPNQLITAYLKRSYSSFKLNNIPGALHDLHQLEELRSQFNGDLLKKELLVEHFKLRSIYYRRAGKYREALVEALESFHYLEVYKADQSEYKIQKYKLFNHIGIAYRHCRDLPKALEYLDKSITLQEDMQSHGEKTEVNDFPKVLKERALTFRLLKQFDHAEKDYILAIHTLEELIRNGNHHLDEGLSELYLYQGINNRFLKRNNASLTNLLKAVEMKKELLAKGELVNISSLYESFRQIVVTLNQEEVIDDGTIIESIIKQNEELIEAGFFARQDYHAIQSFINYSKLLFRVGLIQDSIHYMQNAIQTAFKQISILDERQIHDFGQESILFLKRLRNKTEERRAFELFSPLLEKLLSSKNRNLLLLLYCTKIEYYLRANRLQEAYDDLINLYVLRNSLYKEGKLKKVIPLISFKDFMEIYLRMKKKPDLVNTKQLRQYIVKLFITQIKYHIRIKKHKEANKLLKTLLEFTSYFKDEPRAYREAIRFVNEVSGELIEK
jgi:tetratricopeptide (TPR) repeat protein